MAGPKPMSGPEVKPNTKATLLAGVGSRLAAHGFAKRRGWSFERGMEGGRHAVHLAMINYPRVPWIDVTVDLAIRFDALEDLLNAANDGLSRAEKKQTFSVGCELGNLRDGHQHPWERVQVEDVPVVADGVVRLVEAVGLPFFDRFSSMAEALRGLEEPTWGPLISPLLYVRAQRVIGLKYLLEGNGAAEAVIPHWIDLVGTKTYRELPWLEAFVAALRARSELPTKLRTT